MMIAAVAALLPLVSCQEKETTYLKGYAYEIEYEAYQSWATSADANAIFADLCAAVNYNPNGANAYDRTPSDAAKKAACKAVQEKYANVGSVYVLFTLYKITADANPDVADTKEAIEQYAFGDALKHDYVVFQLFLQLHRGLQCLQRDERPAGGGFVQRVRPVLPRYQAGFHRFL